MEFIREARTVLLYEKAIKTDIYAVSFALIAVSSFKVLLGNVSLNTFKCSILVTLQLNLSFFKKSSFLL